MQLYKKRTGIFLIGGLLPKDILHATEQYSLLISSILATALLRIRNNFSTGRTAINPSPALPVWAVSMIARAIFSALDFSVKISMIYPISGEPVPASTAPRTVGARSHDEGTDRVVDRTEKTGRRNRFRPPVSLVSIAFL